MADLAHDDSEETVRQMEAVITFFTASGEPGSCGTVVVRGRRISYGQWLLVGDHVARAPRGAIRRIALDWQVDGEDRAYEGWDERSQQAYAIAPAGPEAG